jgi:hypothetical protein
MNQGSLFDFPVAGIGAYGQPAQPPPAPMPATPPPPIDPNVAEADVPRLKGQNGEILALLHRGPVTNAELITKALKYTGRISDIRRAIRPHGWDIACERHPGGLSVYTLIRRA